MKTEGKTQGLEPTLIAQKQFSMAHAKYFQARSEPTHIGLFSALTKDK